ncbi:MAG: prepilin-type N-terminal cleavage/methylation domain-containing protein [Firmicutes bacterium]|nr:prepilin-type N-terminal cleavage/methylation domain-containing protein [Bacillota bacterium]
MKQIKSKKGFTLLEILVAMAILVTTTLIVLRMIDFACASSAVINKSVLATIIAEKKVEEIRNWACSRADGTRYNFYAGNWSLYNGTLAADLEHPDFTVKAENFRQFSYSPASNLTSPFELKDSVRKVQVKVSWEQGGANKSITLVTYIGEPLRLPAKVEVTPSGAQTVNAGEQISFSAQAYDANNEAIPDMVYKWYVVPETSNGTVIIDPADSSKSVFQARYQQADGTWRDSPAGNCKVSVRVRRGERNEDWGYSGEIQIVP